MAIFSTIGSIVGANAQKSATREASRVAQQTADKTINFAMGERDRTEARIAPYDNRGNAAGEAINALLGLSSFAPATTPQPQASFAPGASPMAQNGFYPGDFAMTDGRYGINGPVTNDMDRSSPLVPMSGGTMQTMGAPAAPTGGALPASANPQQRAQDAFRGYIDNSDYAFRMGEGQNALAVGFGAGGARQSGAALKELERYRQNLQAGYRNEYLGHLYNQQGVGLSGANALAGVSTNLVNTVGQNNQSAGTVAAQGALARGNINANLFGNIGSSFGKAAGMFLGGGF